MDGKLIENVTKLKYLSVIVNQNLDWCSHANDVVQRIMNSLICMRMIKHCLTKRVFTHLYYFVILPHINYCSTVWGSLKMKYLKRLQKCQKKILSFSV